MRQAADNLCRLKVKFFTDNLIVAYSVMVPTTDLIHLCELLAQYQLSMALSNGLFLRGGISLGTMAFDEGMMIGDCLLKAHQLEKTTASTPRIIIDDKLKDVITKQRSLLDRTWQSTLDSRLLCDSDGYFFVNYLHALYQPKVLTSMVLEVNEDQLSAHRQLVERSLGERRLNPHIWYKYFWVANYHNYFCDANGQARHKIPGNLLLPQPTKLAPSQGSKT
jgi:hypothetical protein